MVDCNRYIPESITEPPLIRLWEEILDPSGIWADYNILYNGWKAIARLADKGLIYCTTDVPPEPDPSDYPDISSAATIPDDEIGWNKFPMNDPE